MAPYRTRPVGFRVRVKGPSQQILSLGIIAKGLFRVQGFSLNASYHIRPVGFRVKGPSQQILSLGILAKGLFWV
jgi:hypothetical protein